MDFILSIGMLIIAILICLLPLKLAAKLVGSDHTSFFNCFIASIIMTIGNILAFFIATMIGLDYIDFAYVLAFIFSCIIICNRFCITFPRSMIVFIVTLPIYYVLNSLFFPEVGSF